MNAERHGGVPCETARPAPGSPPRRGPRPLPLHLLIAQTTLLSSLGALPMLSAGSAGWRPSAALAALAREIAGHPADAVRSAVEREVRHRLDRFLAGLEGYRHHPYRRDVADPPALWQEGGSRLLDYGIAGGTAGDAPGGGVAAGRPVLFVPSLVNRGYILDLSARRSLLRWLAGRGFRPLLLDWGWPEAEERGFSLGDYIAGRLERALDAALGLGPGRLPAVGYCMGGLLVTALAGRRPEALAGLALLATPWDFHAEHGEQARRLGALAPGLGRWLDWWGELPLEALQGLFVALDPMLGLRKFSRFAALDPGSPAAENFVALEDWLNDGVPLAGPVATECLAGWYGGNSPAVGTWRVAGETVRPGRLDLPSLHLIPSRDRIVPPASARALAAAMPGARTLELPLGHIGMIASARAPEAAWHPLARWLAALAGDAA